MSPRGGLLLVATDRARWIVVTVTRSGGRAGGGGRQWSRTAETRRVFLNAAKEVFTTRGFAGASVAEVVERANSSVGSLYHHFGGKSELFLALWEDHQQAQEERAAAAVARARKAGELDPLALFIHGARAFLERSWANRDLVRLFYDGDGPPGFELLRRRRNREWVRQNRVLLRAEDSRVNRVIVIVLTTVIGETAREVVSCDSKEEAHAVIEAMMGFLQRLGPLHLGEE
ncbi:MAG: TetR family transcriptional regulator [Streptosporangiales bacterium]|nr:TetR family transcriptional regulator [Streptosporangiales bacterium]